MAEPYPQRGPGSPRTPSADFPTTVYRHRVGRMEAATASIAVDPFELVALEHAAAARHVHCPIDDAEGPFNTMVFGGDQLGRPHIAVIDPIRPIFGDAVGVRDHPFQFDHDIGNRLLYSRW